MKNFVSALVDSFLGWPLPKTFSPDCGISFDGRKGDEWNKNKTWPVGTNLLTADEARQMFESALTKLAEDADQWRFARMLDIVTDDDMAKINRARGIPSVPVIGRDGVKDIADDPKGFADALREQYGSTP